ncbi:hypothetical protein [Alicyclobacillus sp. ALC3]|uniref:hypothetical protein n=1 Tax=Alicyclobacillus sp. ALC3 TaxID=2796143 RepID=UPI00237945C5|nr:hypothetical protein [Alicyclobacillus sp. ALC3]WDL96955.1 hypothetical protein JC200_22195 [Alicyclobacillus sp. ALC3]
MPERVSLPNGAHAYRPSPSEMTAAEQFMLLDPSINTLADFQQAKIAELQEGYAATIAGGFTSNATGTATVFGWEQLDQAHLSQLQAAINQSIETFPVTDYADIYGNLVTLTAQANLTQLETDANNFAWANIKQIRALVGQVRVATTIAEVQAVGWSPGNYTPQA